MGASTKIRRTSAPTVPGITIGVGAGALAGSAFWLLGPLGTTITLAAMLLGFLLLSRPGAFLFFVVLPYAALQIFLREFPALTLAGVSINASQVFMVGLAGLLSFRMMLDLVQGRFLPRPTGAHLVNLAFVGWCSASFLITLTPDATTILGRLVACLVVHYAGCWLASRQRVWVLATLGGTTFVAALSAVVDRLSRVAGVDSITTGAIRSRGAFSTAVATAVIAFAGLPVFTELWLLQNTRRERLIALGGLAAVAIALVLTLTRTAALGVLFFALFMFVWRPKQRAGQSRIAGWKVVLPFVAVLGALYWVPEEQMEARVRDMASIGGEMGPEVGSGRAGIWNAIATDLSRSSISEILLGHGLGDVWNLTERALNERVDSHNSYLSTLYDLGIVGLVLYVSVLLTHLRLLRPTVGDSPDMAVKKAVWRSYCAAYALSTVMFNGYVYAAGPQWFTYLGLGYALAVASGSERRGTEPTQTAG